VPSSKLSLVSQTKQFKITFLIDNFEFNVINKRKIEPTYVGGTYFIKTVY